MNRWWIWGIGLVLSAVSVIGLATGLNRLENSLQREQRISARRVGQAFLPAIRKAHRMKDDLALQEVLQAMASVPGVGYAGILGTDKQWIAHSQPAFIGQPLLEKPRSREDLSLTLQEGGDRSWATLLYTVSDKSLRQILRRLNAIAWSGLVLVWSVIAGALYLLTDRLKAQSTEIDEWKTAYQYEKEERERLMLRLKAFPSRQ